jgi:hypothetical protein
MAINLSAVLTAFNSAGVDIRADFHTLTSAQVDAVLEQAQVSGYRKPVNANGSRARYFFSAVQRAYLRDSR